MPTLLLKFSSEKCIWRLRVDSDRFLALNLYYILTDMIEFVEFGRGFETIKLLLSFFIFSGKGLGRISEV